MITLSYGMPFDWIETDSCALQICERLFRKRSSIKLGDKMQTGRITGNAQGVGKGRRQRRDIAGVDRDAADQVDPERQ